MRPLHAARVRCVGCRYEAVLAGSEGAPDDAVLVDYLDAMGWLLVRDVPGSDRVRKPLCPRCAHELAGES